MRKNILLTGVLGLLALSTLQAQDALQLADFVRGKLIYPDLIAPIAS